MPACHALLHGKCSENRINRLQHSLDAVAQDLGGLIAQSWTTVEFSRLEVTGVLFARLTEGYSHCQVMIWIWATKRLTEHSHPSV